MNYSNDTSSESYCFLFEEDGNNVKCVGYAFVFLYIKCRLQHVTTDCKDIVFTERSCTRSVNSIRTRVKHFIVSLQYNIYDLFYRMQYSGAGELWAPFP